MTQPGPDLFGEMPEEAPVAARPEKTPAEMSPASISVLRALARPCNLGCGQLIVLAVTLKTMRNGTQATGWMPVDIDQDPRGGNVRLVAEGRGVRAHVIGRAADRAGCTTLHRSHMETCPNRERPKKKGRG